jgi:hypothetical protein
MQQNYLELLETLNHSSAELLKTISESNQTAFNSLLTGQWDMATWGKLAKTTLDATQAIAHQNTTAINAILRNAKNPKELEAVASNLEQFSDLVGSMATALTEMQVNAFSQCASGYVSTLRAMKSAGTPEEILAVQTQHYTYLQEKMKSSAEEALLKLSSLQSGLKAWVEGSVEKMAESGDRPE